MFIHLWINCSSYLRTEGHFFRARLVEPKGIQNLFFFLHFFYILPCNPLLELSRHFHQSRCLLPQELPVVLWWHRPRNRILVFLSLGLVHEVIGFGTLLCHVNRIHKLDALWTERKKTPKWLPYGLHKMIRNKAW